MKTKITIVTLLSGAAVLLAAASPSQPSQAAVKLTPSPVGNPVCKDVCGKTCKKAGKPVSRKCGMKPVPVYPEIYTPTSVPVSPAPPVKSPRKVFFPTIELPAKPAVKAPAKKS